MSITYSIGCKDCKKHLWIGQSNYLYSGEEWTMEALETFLFTHQRHSLIFDANCEGSVINDDWQEIKILRSNSNGCSTQS